jgi:glutamine phosphoribosylpyrophosphate amidotransferase
MRLHPNGIRPSFSVHASPRGAPSGAASSSEDCAFGPIGFKTRARRAPGELIITTEEGSHQQPVHDHHAYAASEYIYPP